MAIVLKITKKSAAHTGMRIFRSEDRAQVYTSAAIADVPVAATYSDDSAESGKVYFYGVELYHATDKTQLPIIQASGLTDYGPFAAIVSSNITNFGSPLIFGDAKLGILNRATLAQFSGQPAPPNTGDKFREILLAAVGTEPFSKPVADSAMVAGLINGKLVVLPTAVNFYLRNEYASGNVVADVTKVVNYLRDNPAQALIDIAGYRWRIKAMSKEFMANNAPLFYLTVRAAAFRPVPHVVPINYAYQPLMFVYSEVDGAVTSPSPNANNVSIDFAFDNTGTNQGRVVYMYFEYVGPTPV